MRWKICGTFCRSWKKVKRLLDSSIHFLMSVKRLPLEEKNNWALRSDMGSKLQRVPLIENHCKRNRNACACSVMGCHCSSSYSAVTEACIMLISLPPPSIHVSHPVSCCRFVWCVFSQFTKIRVKMKFSLGNVHFPEVFPHQVDGLFAYDVMETPLSIKSDQNKYHWPIQSGDVSFRGQSCPNNSQVLSLI